MPQNIFFELSIVLVIAAVVSILIRILRQPMIIGYIITGIIAGPFFLDLVTYSDSLAGLSQIGIAFLLFIVGLNLNFKTLKEVGIVSLIGGLGQVIFTSLIGYIIAIWLGFSNIEALYIGIALTFSSTIIIVKLLYDKKDLDSLYGKISVGMLIVQDIVVVLILMFIANSKSSEHLLTIFSTTLVKMAGLILFVILMGYYIMPKVLHFMAKSQELLFLFSIGWVLVMSTILHKLGFSIEIGALFAGITIAPSPYHYEISSKIKSLRDFFIILFFVLLGSELVISAGTNIMLSAVILSLFVLVGNPLIMVVIMGLMGYHRRIGFLVGLTMAQISEFSLILVLLGQSIGHINQSIVSLVTIVGIITIAGSVYLIQYSNRIYPYFSQLLKVFERKMLRKEFVEIQKGYKIILFGYNRVGYSLLKSFRKIKKSFLVVDYNPETIKQLHHQGIPHKYGDAGDIEFLDELRFDKIEMILSTIPDLEVNLLITEKIRSMNKKAIVIITSHQIDDAFRLYKAGADYVVLPHFLGGAHASALVEKFGTNINKFVKEKYRHIEELEKRKHIGHEHPKIHN